MILLRPKFAGISFQEKNLTGSLMEFSDFFYWKVMIGIGTNYEIVCQKISIIIVHKKKIFLSFFILKRIRYFVLDRKWSINFFKTIPPIQSFQVFFPNFWLQIYKSICQKEISFFPSNHYVISGCITQNFCK